MKTDHRKRKLKATSPMEATDFGIWTVSALRTNQIGSCKWMRCSKSTADSASSQITSYEACSLSAIRQCCALWARARGSWASMQSFDRIIQFVFLPIAWGVLWTIGLSKRRLSPSLCLFPFSLFGEGGEGRVQLHRKGSLSFLCREDRLISPLPLWAESFTIEIKTPKFPRINQLSH